MGVAPAEKEPGMSRTTRFLSGVGLGYFSQVVVTIAGLWLTPFLLSRLGGYEYGLWLVSLQLQAYLTLVDFGVLALLSRDIAMSVGKAGGVHSAADLQNIAGRSGRLVLWQMPVLAVLAAGLWLLMSGEWGTLRWPLGLMLITFVVLYPLRIFSVMLYGLQDHGFNAKAQFVSWLAGFVVTVVFVMAGGRLYALSAGWAVTQALTSALGYWRLRTRFPTLLPERLPRVAWTEAKAQLSRGAWLSANQVAQILLAGTDLVMIGKLLGPEAVVGYAITGKLVTVLANQPIMLGVVAGPALAEITTGETRERMSHASTALGQAILLLSGAIACVVLAVNKGFVAWWVGPQQYGGFLLTAAFVISMVLRHWNVGLGAVLFSLGHEKRLCQSYLADGVVTVVGGVILVYAVGPIGAPLGSIVGVMAASLPINLTVLIRAKSATPSMLVSAYGPWLWRFVLLAVMSGAAGRAWVPGGFLAIASTSALVTLVYGLVMLPVMLRAPIGSYVRPRLAPLGGRVCRALGVGNPA